MADRFNIYPDINFAMTVIEPGLRKFEDFMRIAQDFRDHEHFSSVHYSLIDMRGCMFDFDLSKIDEMKELFYRYLDKDNQLLAVYMVDKPVETAYIHLFFRSLGLSRDYCSSFKGAFEKFNFPFSIEEFQKLTDI